MGSEDICALLKGVQDLLGLPDNELELVVGLGGQHARLADFRRTKRLEPAENIRVVERLHLIAEILASAGLLSKCEGRPVKELILQVLSQPRPHGSFLDRIKSGSTLSLLSVQDELYEITGGVWVRSDAGSRT